MSAAATAAIAKVRSTRRCRKRAIKPSPPMRSTELAGGAGPDQQQREGVGFSTPSGAAFPQRPWLPSRYVDGGARPEAGPQSTERWRNSSEGLMADDRGSAALGQANTSDPLDFVMRTA